MPEDGSRTEQALRPGPSWISLLLPTNGAMFFGYLLGLFLLCRPLLLLGDGGTLRHVMLGSYAIAHHSFPLENEVITAVHTSAYRVPECISDVLIAGMYQLFGLNGIVFIAALAMTLALTWSYQFGRARGLGVISGLVVLVIVIFSTSIHWSARAHLFSYLPFMLLYMILFMDVFAEKLRPFLVAGVMLLWANLHGSFILGVVMILCKLGGDLLDDRLSAGSEHAKTMLATVKSVRLDLACLVAGIVASAINIRGMDSIAYVYSYAGNPTMRAYAAESQGLSLWAGPPVFAFLALMLIVIAVWKSAKRLPLGSEMILLFVFFLGGVFAMRLIPYFSLLVLPVLGEPWKRLRTSWVQCSADADGGNRKTSEWDRTVRKIMIAEERLDAQDANQTSIRKFVYAGSALITAVFLFVPLLKLQDYDPERLPVKATTWLKDHPPVGNGFNVDNWGDYIYCRTGRPIFINERHQCYDPAFIKKYLAVYTGNKKWKAVFDEYKLSWALVPNELPIVTLLTNDPSWQQVYKDDLATILERKPDVDRSASKKN